jgi:Na+-transporting NADH:ubiquinone oxidoreductase subunit A
MAHITITKGLSIPIEGKPEGQVQSISTAEKYVALDLDTFHDTRLQLLVNVGDQVKIGQPLVSDKDELKRAFVSPAAGTVHEIVRGEKRRLIKIIIEVASKEEQYRNEGIVLNEVSREELVEKLAAAGAFSHIRMRPFDRLASLSSVPRNIFVKAVESAPFMPKAEWQVEGYEEVFQLGLQALSKLTSGKVHLVYHKESDFSAFTNAQFVEKHTIEGPHPIGYVSTHIHHIDPIQSNTDVVWTVNAYDVVVIGQIIKNGHYHTRRIIGIGGTGIDANARRYLTCREGCALKNFVEGYLVEQPYRLISGDVLMGRKANTTDYLGFNHFAISVIPEPTEREFLHFFRAGLNKFTASRAYLSGIMCSLQKLFRFTTSMHGEERAFIDAAVYQRVTPMNVPIMHLVKAVIAEDYTTAEELGLLEVAVEDFALPTFVCPSKIEMTEIMEHGLHNYSKQLFS